MITAQQIHEWYLEIVKKLNPESYNQKAVKPFEELTAEQQAIDGYVATKVNTEIARLEATIKNYSWTLGKTEQNYKSLEAALAARQVVVDIAQRVDKELNVDDDGWINPDGEGKTQAFAILGELHQALSALAEEAK